MPGQSCTADQIETVLAFSLAALDDFLLDETNSANLTTTPGIVGRNLLLSSILKDVNIFSRLVENS